VLGHLVTSTESVSDTGVLAARVVSAQQHAAGVGGAADPFVPELGYLVPSPPPAWFTKSERGLTKLGCFFLFVSWR